MLRNELNNALLEELKKACENVDTNFVHPVERANQQGEFPYVTVVWKEWRPENNGTPYGKQFLDIIGIVKADDEDLTTKSAELEQMIINVLRKNEVVKNNILAINNSNLFQPFGLNAGVFPPYAGVRFEIEIGNVHSGVAMSLKQLSILSGRSHKLLIDRDATDQHPISAITGLQDELDLCLKTETDPVFTAWESSTDYLVSGDNVSELVNDAGYLTTHQDLSGYAQLSGATFTGDISANNLSGTNTGDQDFTPTQRYAFMLSL